MMKVLLLGFEPFGGELINPAWEMVQEVNESQLGCYVIKKQIPTVFNRAISEACAAIEREKPDLVIALGQAGGRSNISIERIAINLDDASIPDNENQQPRDRPVVEGGPAAYFTTLPSKEIVHSLQENGLPASISNTAGTFVCNHLMYGILHYIAKSELPIRAGFVHVPYLPEQAVKHRGAPSMNLGDLIKALEVIITVSLV